MKMGLWRKRMKSTLALLLGIALLMNAMEMQSFARDEGTAPEQNTVSGESGTLVWDIDENGLLTISGDGENCEEWWGDKHFDEIISAKITAKNIKSTSNWFYGCTNLESVDMGEFDASQVTDMSFMFSGCSSLTRIDLSGLDTSQVTDMSDMFSGCSSLKSIGLSGLDTSQVTNMSSMFSGCSSLASIGLSGLDTGQVTNMSYMFSGCKSLTKIDLSGLDTSQVTDMCCMFENCSSLKNIDLSGLDTSRVTDMCGKYSNGGMFSGCSSLKNIDLSGLDTSQVTDMSYMFLGCSSLSALDVSGFDTSQVTYMSYMFLGCSSLTVLDVSGFDTSQVTDMRSMFEGCSSLVDLDVSKFDTSKVDDMMDMFFGCKSLINLNVSGFYIGDETHSSYMFNGCDSLKGLDLRIFSGHSEWSSNSSRFFIDDCDSLEWLITPVNYGWDFDLPVLMCDDKGQKYTKIPANQTSSIRLTKAEVEPDSIVAVGTMYGSDNTDLVWTLTGDGTLTISGKKHSEDGTVYESWGQYDLLVRKVNILDVSDIDCTDYWFSGCNNLKSVSFSRFDTSKVEDMEAMFDGCSDLTELDLSGWNTSQVTDMTNMFEGCNSLTKLELSGWDTGQVTYMCGMFDDCNSLVDLDLSGFDTSQVTDMDSMFEACSSLVNLDLSGWDTSRVTRMEEMFAGCSSLVDLDLSGFDTSQVTYMIRMFLECYSLNDLDLSGWNTSQVTDMTDMFNECNSLGNLDLSSWDTGKVTSMGSMFFGCYNLKRIETPLSIKTEASPYLPYTMYDSEGNPYTELPANLAESITLTRRKPGSGSRSSYTVSFDLRGHGTAIKDVDVEAGKRLDAPETPAADGYIFGGWYKEAACRMAWNFAVDTVNTDTTLFAKWTKKGDVSGGDVSGGDVSGGDVSGGDVSGGDVSGGDVSGGDVSGGDSSGSESELPILKDYKVSFDLQGQGTQIEPATVQEGGKVTKPADPAAEGYVFGGWFKDANCTASWNFAEDVVAADTTIYAKWIEAKNTGDKNNKDKNTVTPEDVDDAHYGTENRKELNSVNARIGAVKPKVYDGKPYLPVVKVTASVDGKTAVLTEGVDYRVLYKNNVNAGTGTVIVKGNNAYKGEITKGFMIEQKPIGKLKVTAGGLGKNAPTTDIPVYLYDGGYKLEKGRDYTIENVAADFTASKGNKEVMVTAAKNGNYTGSRTVKVTVYDTDKVLQDSDVTLEYTAKDYNGKAWKPGVTVKFDGKELDKKSFSVKYTNNKEAGTAYVTVTGKKDYAGCVVKTFEIKPVTGGFKLKAEPKAVTYSGKLQKPKLSVTDANGKGLKLNKDYLLFYSNNLHAGKAAVTIRGLGNYAGTKDKVVDFVINPQKISKVSVKGTAEKPLITYAKKTLKEGVDYTLTRGAEEKGKVAITLEGKGDFTDTVTRKVKAK